MSSKGASQTAQKANRNNKSMYSQEKLRLERDMKDAYMNLSYINIMKKLIRLNELSEFLSQSRRYRCLEETVDMGQDSLESGHSSVTVGALLIRDGAFIKHYCTLLEKAGEFNREGRKMEIYRRFHNQIDIRESMFKAYFMKDVLKHMKEATQKGAVSKMARKNNQIPPASTKKSPEISSKAHLQTSWSGNISKELSAVSSKSPLKKLPWDQAIKRDYLSLLRNPLEIKDMAGMEEPVPEIIRYYSTLKYCARKSEILNFAMKTTLGVYKSYVVRRGAVTLTHEQRETIYEGIFLRRTTDPDDWLSKSGIERCLRQDDTVEVVVIDE